MYFWFFKPFWYYHRHFKNTNSVSLIWKIFSFSFFTFFKARKTYLIDLVFRAFQRYFWSYLISFFCSISLFLLVSIKTQVSYHHPCCCKINSDNSFFIIFHFNQLALSPSRFPVHLRYIKWRALFSDSSFPADVSM